MVDKIDYGNETKITNWSDVYTIAQKEDLTKRVVCALEKLIDTAKKEGLLKDLNLNNTLSKSNHTYSLKLSQDSYDLIKTPFSKTSIVPEIIKKEEYRLFVQSHKLDLNQLIELNYELLRQNLC